MLKQLMIKKKIDTANEALEELRSKEKEFEERSKALEQ